MQWLQVLIVTLGWVKDFLWILLCQRSPPRGLQGIDLPCASWQLPHQFAKGILSGLDIAAFFSLREFWSHLRINLVDISIVL